MSTPDHPVPCNSWRPAGPSPHPETPCALQFVVSCNSIRGTLLLGPQRVICECADCQNRPEADRDFSCTQFEAHCGAGAAKKWKASFKIEPGQLDEVPQGERASPWHRAWQA